MACNENIIKNMANEVTRICQASSIHVQPEFVVYMIELLLLNPKYGKLFTKTLNRNCLAYFVNECVAIITRGGTSLNTLKMQFIMLTNYDVPNKLIERHYDALNQSLSPLYNEILDEESALSDEAEKKKMYRKISIYILLASGLGSPTMFLNLKENMAALESVFKLEELPGLLQLQRSDRMQKLERLIRLASGVRLFNRDCGKGGENLPDLPFDLVEAGKACLSTLSNALITVMQRVNTLTTAIDDTVSFNEDTKTMYIDVPPHINLTVKNYEQVNDLVILNRQYELYIRHLLNDVKYIINISNNLVEQYRVVLVDLHDAIKYKGAVPRDTIFPLFERIWMVWRQMQDTMFLVSTVNRVMSALNEIQEYNKMPFQIIEKMLEGKVIISDEERVTKALDTYDILMAREFHCDPVPMTEQFCSCVCSISKTMSQLRDISFLGFCVMYLNVGALIPSNRRLGVIKHFGGRYGFCSIKMAAQFKKDPTRFVNVVLEFARNNPHIINLLGIEKAVRDVRDIDELVVAVVPKKMLNDQKVQTVTHPVEEFIDRNYTWDLWEWKRRACQWANIVNCRTHSTQTNYSHLRSEIQCQTTDLRDKGEQTKKSTGTNTSDCKMFLWGLRGQLDSGQHAMSLVQPHSPSKALPKPMVYCNWPCNKELKAGASKGELGTELSPCLPECYCRCYCDRSNQDQQA